MRNVINTAIPRQEHTEALLSNLTHPATDDAAGSHYQALCCKRRRGGWLPKFRRFCLCNLLINTPQIYYANAGQAVAAGGAKVEEGGCLAPLLVLLALLQAALLTSYSK